MPGSSNFPLRGHKYSFFEGGCRAAAFVASPLLPAAVRGTRNSALLHISDWCSAAPPQSGKVSQSLRQRWATFAVLAGLPPIDEGCAERQWCVPVDGVNVWPAITTGGPAPRAELLVGIGAGGGGGGMLISSEYKLIDRGGNTPRADGWSAQYPGTTPALPPPASGSCTERPCLFNIATDPRETTDLIDAEPALAARLTARLANLCALSRFSWLTARSLLAPQLAHDVGTKRRHLRRLFEL